MTKQTKRSKLQLTTQTIRTLGHLELVAVQGGGVSSAMDPDCGCEIRRR